MSHRPSRTRSLAVAGLAALSLLGAAASLASASDPAPDTELPTPPLYVFATTGSDTQHFIWTAATDNVGVDHYDIYDGAVLVGSVAGTQTAFDYVHPSADGFLVTVVAVDAAGNRSTPSHANELGVLPPDPTPPPGGDVTAPSAPGQPVLLGYSSQGLVMSWPKSTDDRERVIHTYAVYAGATKILTTYGSNPTSTTSAIDADATATLVGYQPGTPYSLTVAASDSAGNTSAPSPALVSPGSTAPDTTPPTAPVLSVKSRAYPGVIAWTPSEDNVGVVAYDLYDSYYSPSPDKIGTFPASQTETTFIPLTNPDAGYSIYVRARDAAGNVSSPSNGLSQSAYPIPGSTPTRTPTPVPTVIPTRTPVPTVIPTPSPAPSPNPTPGNATYGFTVGGSTSFKTLTTGTVATTGTLDLTTSPAGGGTAYAQFSLALASAKLTALGVLPLVAKIQLVPPTTPLGPLSASGTFTTSSLSLITQARLKVVSATVFGISVVQGSTCQTTQASTIALKSTTAFTPQTGGTLAGTFSLSNLAGCGGLTSLVSPLVAGSGNTILLKLAPGPLVAFPG